MKQGSLQELVALSFGLTIIPQQSTAIDITSPAPTNCHESHATFSSMATPQRFSRRAAITTFADSSSISTLTANTLHRATGRSESSMVESDSGNNLDINEDADKAFIQFIDNGDLSDKEEDR